MSPEKQQQFSARIVAANKSEMIVIIYDIILEYLDEANDYYKSKLRKDYSNSIKNIRNCLSELIQSINCENELAPNYAALYLFCNEQLDQSEIKYDNSFLVEVQKIIAELKEAAIEISKQDKSLPVMENAQTLYSGLTYGKNNNPIELMTDPNTNRGFLI